MIEIEKTILDLCKEIGAYPHHKDCFSLYYKRSFQYAEIKIYFNFIINSKHSIDDMEFFIDTNFNQVKNDLIKFFNDPTQRARYKKLYERSRYLVEKKVKR